MEVRILLVTWVERRILEMNEMPRVVIAEESVIDVIWLVIIDDRGIHLLMILKVMFERFSDSQFK